MAFNAKAMMGAVGGGGERRAGPAPTADDIFEAARYLGIDPITEPQYLWVAEEMLTSALPDGFTEHTDAEGNIYFYNSRTGESEWEHPLYEFCSNMYRKLKVQGGDQALNAAQDFFETRLKKRVLKAWYGFMQARRRKVQKARMVMKYAQSNVVATYFERWKQWNAHRIVKRRKEKLIIQYYHQQQVAKMVRSWRKFTKEQRSKRRKGKRALAYLRSATAIKSLRRWREFVARQKHKKRKVLAALRHADETTMRRLLGRWRGVAKVLQARRYKLKLVSERLLHRKVAPAFRAWSEYRERSLDKKAKKAAALRQWSYGVYSACFAAWTAYLLRRRAKAKRHGMITRRWRFRTEGVAFGAWCEAVQLRRVQFQRAVAHWELNCLTSLRRRVHGMFVRWTRYTESRRHKNQLTRVAVLHNYDRTIWRYTQGWKEFTAQCRIKAEKNRAAVVHYYDHVMARAFFLWRFVASCRRSLALRQADRRPWLRWQPRHAASRREAARARILGGATREVILRRARALDEPIRTAKRERKRRELEENGGGAQQNGPQDEDEEEDYFGLDADEEEEERNLVKREREVSAAAAREAARVTQRYAAERRQGDESRQRRYGQRLAAATVAAVDQHPFVEDPALFDLKYEPPQYSYSPNLEDARSSVVAASKTRPRDDAELALAPDAQRRVRMLQLHALANGAPSKRVPPVSHAVSFDGGNIHGAEMATTDENDNGNARGGEALVDSVLRAIEAHARGDLEARNRIMASINNPTADQVAAQEDSYIHQGRGSSGDALRDADFAVNNQGGGSDLVRSVSPDFVVGGLGDQLDSGRDKDDDNHFDYALLLQSGRTGLDRNDASAAPLRRRRQEQPRRRVPVESTSLQSNGPSPSKEKVLQRSNNRRQKSKKQVGKRSKADSSGGSSFRRQLHEMFRVFCRAGGGSSSHGQDFGAMGRASSELRLAGWLKFCKNFDIVPTLLKPHTSTRIFNELANHQVTSDNAPGASGTTRSALDYNGFVRCLQATGEHAFGVGGAGYVDNVNGGSDPFTKLLEHLTFDDTRLYRARLTGQYRNPKSQQKRSFYKRRTEVNHGQRSGGAVVGESRGDEGSPSNEEKHVTFAKQVHGGGTVHVRRDLMASLGIVDEEEPKNGETGVTETVDEDCDLEDFHPPSALKVGRKGNYADGLKYNDADDHDVPSHMVHESYTEPVAGASTLASHLEEREAVNDARRMWDERSTALRTALHDRSRNVVGSKAKRVSSSRARSRGHPSGKSQQQTSRNVTRSKQHSRGGDGNDYDALPRSLSARGRLDDNSAAGLGIGERTRARADAVREAQRRGERQRNKSVIDRLESQSNKYSRR